jgi:hypothetical protein
MAVRVHILTALALLGLSGCTREADVARHTVEEYRANKTLRQAVFKQCTNDPGTLGTTPDCLNAREAEQLESIGSLRKSGPVGLDSKRKP